MAAGRPTVTNPTGDLGELVADTGCGLLVGESPAAFADATYSLLRDTELAGRLGSQARRAAEDQISWRALARDLAAFYAGALE
jgi:glycosyltransferase involved in cell wall biosynthesis